MENENTEINDSEISIAISELMQEGKMLAPKTEWNQIMDDIKTVHLEETSLLEKMQKYKYLSAAASILVVAIIAASLAFALNSQETGVVKTADEKEATSTTVSNNKEDKDPSKSEQKDEQSDEKPNVSSPTTTLKKTTPENTTPIDTTPIYAPSITVPTRLTLVSLEPIGTPANTQMYNATFSWDSQGENVRFCSEIDIMEFEDNDPNKASHGIYNSGDLWCDYDTEAIVGNTATYTLELTKGNEFRFYLSAVSLYDNKGPRALAFIVQ